MAKRTRFHLHGPGRQLPGELFLWLAILIFGASSAVIRKLTELGAHHAVDGRNPISLCNVLFVGNLCGLLVLGLFYWQHWNRMTLGQVSRKEWLSLVIVAILSGAIAPALIFQALALTSANTVILVGRLEPPLTLALSIWLLHETVNGWQIGGAIAALTGVALAIGLQPMTGTFIPMLELSLGEWLVIGSTIVLAVSTVIGKKRLARVPLGIYSTMRTALGTVIFFSVASVLYGSDHFMDAFSPFLWQWMLIYGAIIVALGQAFWIKGSRASSVSEASVMASFTPLVGIVAAYLVLGEIPTTAQYVGSSLILVGMGLNQVGLRTRARLAPAPPETPSTASGQAISSVMGFRGM